MRDPPVPAMENEERKRKNGGLFTPHILGPMGASVWDEPRQPGSVCPYAPIFKTCAGLEQDMEAALPA